jgi:phosphoglycolate phosphatase
MIKNIFFDLDGTLIDSSKDILECLEQAYYQNGFTISIPKDILKTGNPISMIINSLTPNNPKNPFVQLKFRDLYDNSEYSNTKLFPEVEKIRFLLGQTYLLTNKPTRPTYRIIHKFHLQFKQIICGDTYFIQDNVKENALAIFMKEHQLKPEETIVVGDTDQDRIAALYNHVQYQLVSADNLLIQILKGIGWLS